MKRVLFLPFCLIFLNACFVSKTLDREVRVRIDQNFAINVINEGSSDFCDNITHEELKQEFMEELKDELSASNVVLDDSNPEYEIHISEITVTESTETETVDDTSSEDHGRTFELTTLEFDAKGDVVKLENGDKGYWSAWKNKSEKVKSSRTAGQLITGSNKERNEYREKDFSENECSYLIGRCGRRSGVDIVKTIIKKE